MAQTSQVAQGTQQNLVNAALLRKIDKLRERNIGKHVPLPQLVVVGDQSSGKSSLLESLTGIPFPRDVGLCTRYATQITQRRDNVFGIDISIIPGPNAPDTHKQHVKGYKNSVLSLEELRQRFPVILQEVNARMGIRTSTRPPSNDGVDSGYTSDGFDSDRETPDENISPRAPVMASQNGSVFSEDILKIEICGPSVDYLTVIDVPGIFRTPIEGVTTKADVALVLKMVEGYIKDSRTIILAVLPCNVDIQTQEIFELAEKYDKKGERTLGILTKPDLVLEESYKAVVCNIVRGRTKQLTLGYYVVRSRGADQDDTGFQNREDIFAEKPWCNLPKDRVGVGALKVRLSELLGHIARREFPKLRKEVGEMLHTAERERHGLGPSRKDEHEQRLFLSSMARQFQDLVRAGLEAEYSSNSAFEHSKVLRLVTRVVSLAEAFSQDFQDRAALRNFKEVIEGTQTQTSRSVNPALVPDIDPDDFPELEGIIGQEFDIDNPEDDITDWIESLYLRSRGMNLGTFSNAVWTSAFKEQSTRWPDMSKAFMSKVILAIHRFITDALNIACVDSGVRDELWAAMLDELLRRYGAGMEAAEFLVSAERDTKPYTLDHHFNENRQKCRGARVAELLGSCGSQNHVDEYGYEVASRGNHTEVTIGEVRKATENMTNTEDIVEKLHDDLSSYYEIARKRFVDNVLNQAVNYRLLFGPSTPLGVFSQEWVIGMKPEQLEAIAGESPSTKENRERLDRKIEDLRAARDILRQ